MRIYWFFREKKNCPGGEGVLWKKSGYKDGTSVYFVSRPPNPSASPSRTPSDKSSNFDALNMAASGLKVGFYQIKKTQLSLFFACPLLKIGCAKKSEFLSALRTEFCSRRNSGTALRTSSHDLYFRTALRTELYAGFKSGAAVRAD